VRGLLDPARDAGALGLRGREVEEELGELAPDAGAVRLGQVGELGQAG
jgi:hypothetical protein